MSSTSTPALGVRGGAVSWAVVGLASGVGVLAFTWMFFTGPDSFLASAGTDGTWLFAVLLVLLAAAVGAQLASGALEAKMVALLGVLAATGGALRMLGAGTAGLDPMFLVLVVAGRALGPLPGFVTGGVTMLVGSVLTGRVGPWTPFQMLACAWVAMGAGLLPGGRRLRGGGVARPPKTERWMLAAYGLTAGVGYGFVTSMWFWPVMAGSAGGLGYDPGAGAGANLASYLAFWTLTALGWDLPRGILTALLCLTAGPAVLAMIRHAITKAGFATPIRFSGSQAESVPASAGAPRPKAPAVIRFDDVSVRYRSGQPLALADVNLTITEGELVVVAGPTGAGKSTLLGCVAGLVPHFSGGVVHGSVVVGGRNTQTHRPGDLADLVGYVGQDPAAGFVSDTVEEELAYSLECLGTPAPAMRRRIEDMLDLLSLAPLRDRRLRTLSGGEQQRVAIGAALTAGCDVLVMDEPTSALDPGGAEDVLAAVHRLVHDLGITVLMTEHRLERAAQFADRVVVVDAGRVRIGAPADMLADSPVAPPVVQLGRLAGWSPPPVSAREARRRAEPLRRRLATAPGRPARLPARRREIEPAASVAGLSARRGRRAVLHSVDLDVYGGEIVALMGRNGAGKSTLLAALSGLTGRESGTVTVAGVDPRAVPADEGIRHVGLVPQDARLLLCANSVADECAGADDDTRAGPGATAATLARIVPELKRPEFAARHPSDLSEGQRLMLALSIVLAAQPAVVLLDEPTRGLDYSAKAALTGLLRDLAKSGHAVMVATHDVEFVADTADRVVQLADGRIVSDGPADDALVSSPVLMPQVAKVLQPQRWLTVAGVRAALTGGTENSGVTDQVGTTEGEDHAEGARARGSAFGEVGLRGELGP